MRTSSDAQVVAGLGRHEEWALKALIESCGKYVYGHALQIVRDPHLAEEIAQDALLVMWWKPERFDPSKSNLRSFLITIARFKAIDVVRREERIRSKERLLDESPAFFETAPADRGVAEAMVVHTALSKLSAVQRQSLFLAFYEGLTYREVAEVLDVPAGTIKTRIRDGLIKPEGDVSDAGSRGSYQKRLLRSFEELSRLVLSQESVESTLDLVSRLAVDTIAGCDVASVSLVRRDEVSTLGSSDPVALKLDALQYESGEGPCLDAIDKHAMWFQIDQMSTDSKWTG